MLSSVTIYELLKLLGAFLKGCEFEGRIVDVVQIERIDSLE